ncbi:GH36-type glycosyl hydrolase domain-containing protein [Gorillibacterium sp. sgz5001074]|uniref:GH36-type glycosyl hydrolase domain-containing protein n=1 Tax=Gorillibacterium sp. sgz5001074 TaxID=3446695 RepID=UPI003F67CD02
MNGTNIYGHWEDRGQRFVIMTPQTPARWFNYLFNDTYYMEVGETGQGSSTAFKPKHRVYTRGFRFFYLLDHDTGEVWCPAYRPLKSGTETFTCTHGLGYTEIRSVSRGIEASVHVFVPREGQQEIWTVTLTNRSGRPREISLFSVFALENGGVMGSKCSYDEEKQILASFSFPYHVTYDDKAKVDGDHTNWVYVYSDRRPDSWDGSQRRFFGGDDLTEIPAAVKNGECFNKRAEAENPVGAMQHALTLQPEEEAAVRFVVGCAGSPEEIVAGRAALAAKGWDVLLQEVERHWEAISATFDVDTPDPNVNAFMNFWLKKQIVLQTRTNRMSNYCPIRNQLQDALGYAMVDGPGAAEYMISVLQGQETSGFIKQWIMTDGSPPKHLCLLNHTDGPVWLLLCFTALINQCGDVELLHRQVGFKNSDETASIYEHLLLAADYMASATGAHGLCLMGDGDWNDPINGPGRLGKGESAWNTMALVYALRSMLPFCTLLNDESKARHLEGLADRLAEAVNRTCWDGDWYVAGFDDFGEPFGTANDPEGRLFLNTQTWAIMSGIAAGERLEKCIRAIDSLDTPFGPKLLEPAFSEWNPKWGRISIKLAGTTENGSIYCHASMFKAFADCVAGRGAQAFDTIAKTLPTNPDNPPSVNLQVPIFVPNFYFGLEDSPNYGQSSHHHSTGTVGWMLWTTLEYVLGTRATVRGLTVDPCIPPEWNGYAVDRTFRDARYRIAVKNPGGTGKGVKRIVVDGREWTEDVLPYESGRIYEVEVYL